MVRNVCILLPQCNVVSETFIRAHVDRLPAKVTVVHSLRGGNPMNGEESILSQRFPNRALRKLSRLIMKRPKGWETTLALVKVFRKTDAHAVLAEFGPTAVRALGACQRTKIPLIAHFHGYDSSRRAILEEYHEDYCRVFVEAAAIVAVSRTMQQKLISMGAPVDKVFLNPCGVDTSIFCGADPESAPPVLLAVGRFVDKKGPHLTILAFAETLRKQPEAKLRMIGDGPLVGPCQDLVEVLRLSDAVTFLGSQPHDVVVQEMRSARGFVQHSLEAFDGDCEGTPVGILEACACGLPVVSTQHAGIPDIVIHEETGFIVGERDVSGMAAHMCTLLDDPVRATRLGLAARRHIEQHFTMEESICRLWKIIEGAVTGDPVPLGGGLSPV